MDIVVPPMTLNFVRECMLHTYVCVVEQVDPEPTTPFDIIQPVLQYPVNQGGGANAELWGVRSWCVDWPIVLTTPPSLCLLRRAPPRQPGVHMLACIVVPFPSLSFMHNARTSPLPARLSLPTSAPAITTTTTAHHHHHHHHHHLIIINNNNNIINNNNNNSSNNQQQQQQHIYHHHHHHRHLPTSKRHCCRVLRAYILGT